MDSKQILPMLVKFMKIAGQYTDKTGEQKKRFVIDSITQKINDDAVAEIIGDVIDYLVDVEKGRLRINPAVKRFMCC